MLYHVSYLPAGRMRQIRLCSSKEIKPELVLADLQAELDSLNKERVVTILSYEPTKLPLLDPQVWMLQALPGWAHQGLYKLGKGACCHEPALEAARAAGVEELEELSDLLDKLSYGIKP